MPETNRTPNADSNKNIIGLQVIPVGSSNFLYWQPYPGAEDYEVHVRSLGDAGWTIAASDTGGATHFLNTTPPADAQYRIEAQMGFPPYSENVSV